MVPADSATAHPLRALPSGPAVRARTAPIRSASSRHGEAGLPGTRTRTVLVAIRHRVVQDLVCETLQQDGSCSTVTPEDGEMLAEALERYAPDLLVVDTGDFPSCCREALRSFPRHRVVVVGPEPEQDYFRSAIGLGAGAWISRDELADDLQSVVRALPPR